MKIVENIALFLSIIACLNYGSIAVFNYDFLKHLFSNMPTLLSLLYFMIGVSSFINIFNIKK